jgi:hypothetical protein
LFELDLPDVPAFKEPVLCDNDAANRFGRIALPVELRAQWATSLHDVGVDSSRLIARLCEGLLIYLSPTEPDQPLTMFVTSGSVIPLWPICRSRSSSGRAADGGAAEDLGSRVVQTTRCSGLLSDGCVTLG